MNNPLHKLYIAAKNVVLGADVEGFDHAQITAIGAEMPSDLMNAATEGGVEAAELELSLRKRGSSRVVSRSGTPSTGAEGKE